MTPKFNKTMTVLFFAVFTALLGYGQPLPKKLESPNIVVIIGDDIGYGDFGCYGNRLVRTTHIDRIASQGMRFTNFYLTASSCSPSRASIISGRYPHNTGAAELHTPVPAGIVLLPQLLRAAGYYTASSGKFHLGDEARKAFDAVQEKVSVTGEGGENNWLSMLSERPKNKPFFLWLAALDAHRPWQENEFEGINPPGKIVPPPYLANTVSTRLDMSRYYDEITRFDHYIGLVENELKRQGVLNNTIIIILSDNGAAFPRGKTRLYDSGMKSPFIVKWSNSVIKKGSSSNSLVSAVDLAPTLLQLAGGGLPASFQGKSFAPLFKNPQLPFRKTVFAEHNWHDYEALERMVRTEDFLYVLNLRPSLSNQGPADAASSVAFEDLKALRDAGKLSAAQADVFVTPRPSEELYDCRADPMQLVNLAGSPMYNAVVVRHRAILQQWKNETADSYPQRLTGDWFSREDGKPLPGRHSRGDMPGGVKALGNVGSGPF
ncbi:MAG: sulfatase [Chitinophagaceae bacterium]